MSKNAQIYTAAAYLLPNVGAVTIRKIKAIFGDLETFWGLSMIEIRQAGFWHKNLDKICASRSAIDLAHLATMLSDQKIKVILPEDDDYPTSLKNIPDYPAALFVRGCLPKAERWLAVVGSRQVSFYGRSVTKKLVGQLANKNLVVVSGLASGVDSVAHQAALQNNIPTVAVIGAGLDWPSFHPATNKDLAKQILDNGGAIMSEFPPGVLAKTFHFPLRNRIIAGLTSGTLVVEAAQKSGALITAKLALQYNREVLAVPGGISSPQSVGTNELIAQGAVLVRTYADIAAALNWPVTDQENIEPALNLLSPAAKNLYQQLSAEPIHIDQLVMTVGQSTKQLSIWLTELELAGLVADCGGQHYATIVQWIWRSRPDLS